MNIRHICILFVLLTIIEGAVSGRDRHEFIWPIDRPKMITGTFGEYRGAHYHHGIDISTGGKTGFAIFAADDGYICTVMYQQWGIGYSVMIQHEDGYRTLYGHMERFSDVILNNSAVKNYLTFMQNRKDFRLDLTKPTIPVKKGVIVGFSGESGIGLEHFHFEVRKGDNEPVNPLTNGLQVPDAHGPVINSISIVPFGSSSRVEGASAEKSYHAVGGRGREYSIRSKTAPVISGKIGIKINAYDRIGIKNSVAVYEITLSLDGKEAYRIRHDRIIRTKSHHVGLCYDYDATSMSAYTMYLYDRTEEKGIVAADTGGKIIHVKVVCTDAANNASILNFKLQTEKPLADATAAFPNLRKGKALELSSDDKQCQVNYPRGSALYDELISLVSSTPPRVSVPGITAKSEVYSLTPTNLCLDRSAVVSIIYDGDDVRKVGMYRFLKNDRYFYCIGTTYDNSDKRFSIPVTRMGKFFLARDDVPPRVRFRNGARFRAGDVIRLYIGDVGTGVDLKSVCVKVDGIDAAWDYDPDRYCIEILCHNTIWAKGKHIVSIHLADLAGNSTKQEYFHYFIR